MPSSTPANPDRLTALVRAVDRAVKDIEGIREGVLEAQWSPSRRLASRPLNPEEPQDAGIRSKGTVSDPTGETAVDLRRVRLRKEIRTAEDHLLRALAYLNGAHAALDRSFAAWEGEKRP